MTPIGMIWGILIVLKLVEVYPVAGWPWWAVAFWPLALYGPLLAIAIWFKVKEREGRR